MEEQGNPLVPKDNSLVGQDKNLVPQDASATGKKKPAKIFMIVVLPAPFGPISPQI